MLRARYADLEVTPESLSMVRTELGLDRGSWGVFGDWVAGLLRGDAGNSWISNRPVLPGMLDALAVSMTLMGFALIVALVVSCSLALPALLAGLRGRASRGSGAGAVALTARGAGPDEPVADNKTKANKALNRRIEFKLLSGK